MGIDSVDQVQRIITTAALGGSATVSGTEKDLDLYESFAVSVFIQRDSADTDVDVIVEGRFADSGAGSTYRTIATTNLAVTAGSTTAKMDQVYSTTMKFTRVRLVNNTGNGLAATEASWTLKPLA